MLFRSVHLSYDPYGFGIPIAITYTIHDESGNSVGGDGVVRSSSPIVITFLLGEWKIDSGTPYFVIYDGFAKAKAISSAHIYTGLSDINVPGEGTGFTDWLNIPVTSFGDSIKHNSYDYYDKNGQLHTNVSWGNGEATNGSIDLMVSLTYDGTGGDRNGYYTITIKRGHLETNSQPYDNFIKDTTWRPEVVWDEVEGYWMQWMEAQETDDPDTDQDESVAHWERWVADDPNSVGAGMPGVTGEGHWEFQKADLSWADCGYHDKGIRSEERRVGKECRSRGSPYH